ncbi:GNAT family N-acetyltransferase [Phytoactinopolyspora halotolerans]|uniref:GNAT family N-acetyltransferase n=1 Tax=Phytoactinopolyspora halotolerans TaxID=1981512 RepID=A0A6L9S799_9ACTN|nr:GNAT family N-acetyltransferase [Phytoactinopolyspora halotolerans]NEE01355.1 GNAT family N-acetyltransferase [Phytoactinopolyspora halotolerans]
MPVFVSPVVPPGRLGTRTQPTLEVDELVMRPWRTADADALVAAYEDDEIQRWHVRSMSRSEALEWLASWPARWRTETGADWAIIRDDALAGRVGLRILDLREGTAEIAYWTARAARGNNIAGRATRRLSTWLFQDIGLHRLELRHSTLNEASCRIAEKAGFAYEGTLRQAVLHQDGWHDMHLHARLAADP